MGSTSAMESLNNSREKEDVAQSVELALFSLTKEEQDFLEDSVFNLFNITKNSLSPLDWAALKGNTDACRMLVKQNANVNDNAHLNGLTPLHLAAINGHEETCSFLLEKHADPNAGPEGFNSLYFARKHLKIFRLLAENGAEGMLAAVSKERCSAALYSLIKELGGHELCATKSVYQALREASRCGNTATCAFLLDLAHESGPILDAGFSEHCRACLCEAADVNQRETCALLCNWLTSKGYRINVPAALTRVARKGFDDICALLVAHGTFFEASDWQFLLKQAASSGNVAMTDLIAAHALEIPNSVDSFPSLEKKVIRSAVNNNNGPSALLAFLLMVIFITTQERIDAGVITVACSSTLFLFVGIHVALDYMDTNYRSLRLNWDTPAHRLLTAYACLKKLGLPRDVIHSCLASLDSDIMKIVLPRLQKAATKNSFTEELSPIPAPFRHPIVKHLCLASLQKLRIIGGEMAAQPAIVPAIVTLLDPNTVETTRGEILYKNIMKRLFDK